MKRIRVFIIFYYSLRLHRNLIVIFDLITGTLLNGTVNSIIQKKQQSYELIIL